MKRHTPSRERIWAEWEQAERQADGAPPAEPLIPPECLPKLDRHPRTLNEIIDYSNQIQKNIIRLYGPDHPSLQREDDFANGFPMSLA